MAPMISRAACTVLWWKRSTRSALSGTTSPFMRLGSCEVTPVGHLLVLHLSDWIHPRANMKARAALHVSAPSARHLMMSMPVSTRPVAMTLTRLRTPVPTRALCTRRRPSTRGMPMEFENSRGAAPVPPSAPSTVMKSGVMPVSTMAWVRASSSSGLPTHSLKPVGFPPESSRKCWMKCIISWGLEKAEWAGGLRQSASIRTPRASAIAGVILPLGRMPPCAGLAP
mmetsp:Transcript_21065/g.66166  ORF Transcript_21065/g.66166 Transcript_21065/m.66166 type:complete len:226 (-) Transcript_21065:975-1652(-)